MEELVRAGIKGSWGLGDLENPSHVFISTHAPPSSLFCSARGDHRRELPFGQRVYARVAARPRRVLAGLPPARPHCCVPVRSVACPCMVDSPGWCCSAKGYLSRGIGRPPVRVRGTRSTRSPVLVAAARRLPFCLAVVRRFVFLLLGSLCCYD